MRYFQGIPTKRIAMIEYGSLDQPIVRPGEPQEEPLGLEFTESDKPVGAMTVRFVAASRIFRIVSVVNDQCGSIDTFEDTTNPDAPTGILENNDILQVVWGRKRYEVRLGANSDITVRFVGGAST